MSEVREHLDSLNDAELIAAMARARADLEAAAEAEKESEWHQACFAGLMTYALEAQRRGIVLATKH
jgi:hypothetical protein